MRLVHLALTVPLALVSTGCILASKTTTTEKAAPAVAAAESAPKDGPKKDGAGKEEESKAEKLAKKERALADARLEHEITSMDCQAEERKAKDAVTDARKGLEKAKQALEQFQKFDRELETKRGELGLERAAWSVEEAKQELEELMAMYRKDDVATLTKELVIGRGKKRLEFSTRGLEHERRELTTKLEFELPRKEDDLRRALEKAEAGLREALAAQKKQEKENELKLRRRDHEIDDLVAEIKKLKEAKEEKPDAKKGEKTAATAAPLRFEAF